MKTFAFTANVEFQAGGLEEAAQKIATHFAQLARAVGNEKDHDPEPWFEGAMSLEPKE